MNPSARLTTLTTAIRWGSALIALLLGPALVVGCAGVGRARGSYSDVLQVDQRPPLVGSRSAADSLFGPEEESERADGIAETHRTELERLVQRFAPTLVLPRNDYTKVDGVKYRLIPTNAQLFADTLRMDLFRIAPYGVHDWMDIPMSDLSADSLLELVDSAIRYQIDPEMTAVLYFDFPGRKPKEWWQAYGQLRTGPESESWSQPTVYAHPFIEGRDRVVIQYWYFYPFNDYVGNHEGDWEHVNVVLTRDRSAIAEVHYYFHHRSVKLPQGDYEPRVMDVTHPVVYVGGRCYNVLDYPVRLFGGERNEGSHGSFPYPGEWEAAAGLGAPESVQDEDSDASRVLPYHGFNVVLTPEPSRIDYHSNSTVLKDWSWLILPVRWGSPKAPSLGGGIKFADVGNTAPFGPGYNAGWNRTAPGLHYPAFHLQRVPTFRAFLEDLLQPWYYLYIFRKPRYVHDTRGTMERKDLERLGLVPRGGGNEIGMGSPILGVHLGLPTGAFSDAFSRSTGISLWRNFWGKLRFGFVEFVGGYQKFSQRSSSGGSLFVYPLTANFALRAPDASLRPYVTVGGGAYGWESRTRVEGEDHQWVVSGWNLGWNGAVGLEYYLRPRVALDVSVKYHSAGNSSGTGVDGNRLRFVTIWIGHYYRF